MKSMKAQQSGFTLVEIAIVLVIIGLLLGGILKGQELINSAKVKSFAQDFRNIQTAMYGYQDRFKALPGDHASAATALTGATAATTPAGTIGNGQINGNYDSATATDESCLAWQHLRLAGFFPGPTAVDCTAGAEYVPKNADGGRIGLSSTMNIGGMTGTFNICSQGILGKFAKQLDTQLDDGTTNTGSLRVALTSAPTTAVANALVLDNESTVVCLSF
jgi:prepilin-type N-terminal cleavage/methylation domain-containing protein